MKKLGFVLLLMLMVSVAHAQLTKVLDPASDFEISWDGGGSWAPYTVTTYLFTVGTPGQHKPFAKFGLNKFEADITDVLTGDTETLAKWEVTIPDPGIVPESIWVIGWCRWRVRVEYITGERDTSIWSDMQNFAIKRTKPPKPPKLVG